MFQQYYLRNNSMVVGNSITGNMVATVDGPLILVILRTKLQRCEKGLNLMGTDGAHKRWLKSHGSELIFALRIGDLHTKH